MTFEISCNPKSQKKKKFPSSLLRKRTLLPQGAGSQQTRGRLAPAQAQVFRAFCPQPLHWAARNDVHYQPEGQMLEAKQFSAGQTLLYGNLYSCSKSWETQINHFAFRISFGFACWRQHWWYYCSSQEWMPLSTSPVPSLLYPQRVSFSTHIGQRSEKSKEETRRGLGKVVTSSWMRWQVPFLWFLSLSEKYAQPPVPIITMWILIPGMELRATW